MYHVCLCVQYMLYNFKCLVIQIYVGRFQRSVFKHSSSLFKHHRVEYKSATVRSVRHYTRAIHVHVYLKIIHCIVIVCAQLKNKTKICRFLDNVFDDFKRLNCLQMFAQSYQIPDYFILLFCSLVTLIETAIFKNNLTIGKLRIFVQEWKNKNALSKVSLEIYFYHLKSTNVRYAIVGAFKQQKTKMNSNG